MKKILIGALATSLLLGCQQYGGGLNREGVGAVVGGATGALAGSQFGGGSGQVAATAVGAIIGAMVGSDIGRQLDRIDQQYYARSAHQALEHTPTGKTVTWRNPDTGHSGSTTVTRTYPSRTNYGDTTYCREYQTSINVAGKTQQAYGTACRQPDGSWKVI